MDSFFICVAIVMQCFLLTRLPLTLQDVPRDFKHGLRVYLTKTGDVFSSLGNDKKTGNSVYFGLTYEDDIPK